MAQQRLELGKLLSTQHIIGQPLRVLKLKQQRLQLRRITVADGRPGNAAHSTTTAQLNRFVAHCSSSLLQLLVWASSTATRHFRLIVQITGSAQVLEGIDNSH
jgi:hypothetical protein